MDAERIHHAQRQLVPGAPVLVVRPTYRPPAMQRSSVERFDSPALALTFPIGEDFLPAEELLLIFHDAGVRFAAAARFVSRDGHIVTLYIDGAWRPVDARRDARYPTAHPALVRIGDDADGLQATITDLSPRGVGVTLAACPSVPAVTLIVEHRDQRAELVCDVASLREEGGHCCLGLIFRELDHPARRLVDDLYDHYRAAFQTDLPLIA